MTISTYRGIAPTLGARVYIDPSAVVIGQVTIGDDSSVWPTAVVRGDVNTITIGARTSIQDGSVLHVTHDGPYRPGGRALIIGSEVTLGHRVTLHACTIGNACLIGMGSILMDNVEIGAGSFVAAGTLLPPGRVVPPGSFVLGSPGRIVRGVSEREVEQIRHGWLSYREKLQRWLPP